MERRHFALPATFVLTLFAFLFFGITRSSPANPRGPGAHRRPPPAKPFVIEWPQPEPPPPSEDAIISGDNRRVDGGGGPPPPTQIDVPGPSIPGAFLVEIDNRVVSVSGTFTTNIPAYWGPGGGDGSRPSMGGGIIPAGLLDKPPRARLQASPQYPMAERSTGITGSVEVEFVVDETGVVQMPRVVRASHPAFAEPTLRAVEKWRFEPGRRDGQVVRFRMKVPVMFNIND